MKISKIRIKHYRSCEEAVFNPHESLSVLIGPNGSGKTNILSAIKLLPALCYTRSRHSREDDPNTSACEIKTWYEIEGVSIVHTAKLNIVTNERNLDEIISSEEYWLIPS
jgi:recombinational DNA repair ATPase RecF